ncbi:MAG: YicC/YloC family endoribonuclease [Desulfuromonadales bacterium]|nr:YicC/YloC family endoribonuclease [Desulfuromonadales bacterium]
MLKSMTGYGKGEVQGDGVSLSVEVRSVNHRFADISVKLPRTFLAFESELRKRVGQRLKRGKIDLFVNYELTGEALAVPRFNRELARAYNDLFHTMQRELSLSGAITAELIAAQKDVVQLGEAQLDESLLHDGLLQALEIALDQLATMRRAEGAETAHDIEARLAAAEEHLTTVVARASQVPAEWQQKLRERLERHAEGIDWDAQRLAQELALFADRCDISEEIVRFRSHIGQFRELLDDSEPVGRKMDFLVQELNREVNTMGSKSNDAELTRSVVALKAELEKIREQVQNIE